MGRDLGRSRLFLAIGLDRATRALLAAHLDANGLEEWPGRLVPSENWHLTLRFLGWTTDVQRDGILRDLDEADLAGPFEIRFATLGAFPKLRRATVTWLGVDRGADALAQLAAASDSAAQRAGFAAEERPFHAHLTLSRVRPAVDVTDLVGGFAPFPVTMPVTAITLFESHLGRGGARYEPIDTIEL